MKKLTLCVCFIIFVMLFSSCGYKYDGESLQCVWRESGVSDENYMVYDFYSDEKVTVTYYNYGIPYAQADCYYEVNKGDEITIVGENGYYDIYTFKIRKNKLTIKLGSKKLKLEKYESEYNKDERIFGSWQDIASGETYYFGEDYEGVGYNETEGGMYFEYSTKGDILYFKPFYNSKLPVPIPIDYKIEDNKLYFMSDGEIDAILERVEK